MSEILEDSGESEESEDIASTSGIELISCCRKPLLSFQEGNPWNENQQRYPRKVRRYLNEPPTREPSERVFSETANAHDDHRSQLKAEKAKMLLPTSCHT